MELDHDCLVNWLAVAPKIDDLGEASLRDDATIIRQLSDAAIIRHSGLSSVLITPRQACFGFMFMVRIFHKGGSILIVASPLLASVDNEHN